MKNILISWIAYNNDWLKNSSNKKTHHFDFKGPNFSVHENFWNNYDKHILLSAHNNTEQGQKDEKLFKLFCRDLQNHYPEHNIEPRNLSLDDPTNLRVIKEKIDDLLLSLNGNQIDIFISPGTPTMQTTWYLSKHIIPNITLFQTYRDKKTIVDLDYSEIPKHMGVVNESNKTQLTSPSDRSKYKSLKDPYERAEKIAKTNNVSALIYGPNGTGKEGLAEHIVDCSSRKNKKYIKVNCAGYTDELLRSELFGYVKGAFTGADKDTKGVFEEAYGGTVFLDEIGDISPFMQVNLLRVLQEKKIQKVGSTKDIDIDVRLIAATNKNLLEMCEKETFRLDLYYRLNPSLSIILPSLQARGPKEIESLIKEFNHDFSIEHKKPELTFDDDALLKLKKYHYPGNIRQLRSIIQSLFVFPESNKISLNDLPKEIRHPKGKSIFDYDEAIRRHLIFAYENGPKKANGAPHMIKIAEMLGGGISKQTFQNKLRDYGVWGTDD